LQDDASKFGAGDPGEGGLVLVFAADLEQVEEVCGRGVDGDEVLVGLGGRGGEGGYFEVFWALGVLMLISDGVEVVSYLYIFLDLDALHRGG